MTSANTRTCTVCQKEFERAKKKKDAARCCSRECGFKLLIQERAEKALQRALGKHSFAHWRACSFCQSHFLARKDKDLFCSQVCASKKYAKAGVQCVDCGSPRKFYSQRCESCRIKHVEKVKHSEAAKRCKKQAKARRRAKGKSVISAPVSLADVVRAHGNRCHLCGKSVDLSTINQPRSATMDHLVPLALGGWHDLSNLRPAHHLCNSLKGAQFTGQLMLTC